MEKPFSSFHAVQAPAQTGAPSGARGATGPALSELMKKCVEQATQEKMAFQPFSLQDCRPKGVSDKLAQGDLDVMDATLHTSERMVRQVYDRRKIRVAKPSK